MKVIAFFLLCSTLFLSACLPGKKQQMITIKSLEHREFVIQADMGVQGTREQVIKRYQAFLDSTPNAPMRAEAVRRLADLQLELSNEKLSGDDVAVLEEADYSVAIQLYNDLIVTYPNYPSNDQVLYQLARAYDSIGRNGKVLEILGHLVTDYPENPYMDEAQFRLAEMQFVNHDYSAAEQSYQNVLASDEAEKYHEQALYKYCWTIYKQQRYEQDVSCFFQLLDIKLITAEGYDDGRLATLERSDRELIDDILRVVSLSFSYLSEDISITDYFSKQDPLLYEHLVFARLGDLYLKKERYTDAATTYRAFSTRNADHIKAPEFHIAAIGAYRSGGQFKRVLQSKLEFVEHYGLDTGFWQQQSVDDAPEVVAFLNDTLVEMSQRFHAKAQRSKKTEDYQKAVHFYQSFIAFFPHDIQAPELNFKLAEALFEDKQFSQATKQYENTAYQYMEHKNSAESGYAALLAYKKHEARLDGDLKVVWHRQSLGSALQFVDRFPAHPQATTVLAKTAEEFLKLEELFVAERIAMQVLQIKPNVAKDLRLSAWLVVGYTTFDHMAYDKAEIAYKQVLSLMSRKDKKRKSIVEHLASSIYKQAELYKEAGDPQRAVNLFLRVGKTTPKASIRPVADYDAAATLMELKQWSGAITILEAFRKAFPKHKLQKEVPAKLAVSYLESGNHKSAAKEFEGIGRNSKDPQIQREAIWEAAELYEKANEPSKAVKNYKNYVEAFPYPYGQAIEARQKIADINLGVGNIKRYHHWLKEIIRVDKNMGSARNDRSRYLAATASLVLAEKSYKSFAKVRLVRPLKKSLKKKKSRMEKALEVYNVAADYGVSEVTTEATHRIAKMYHEFGQDLIASQRPKGLSADELEQYEILLEEQAYPFEEQAISVYEINVSRVSEGIYDNWVSESFKQLASLLPFRYLKNEKSEVYDGAID